jgi:ribosomal protein L40E
MSRINHIHEQTCPFCGAVHEPGARTCPSCDADLFRECPTCGASNPVIARQCLTCGQEMEILEALFARVTGTRAEWLRQVREEAPAVKAQEEAASQARLAEMWAAEKRRREDMARVRAERDRQQRILVTVTVAVVVVVVVVILVALAIATLRPPSPCVYPC